MCRRLVALVPRKSVHQNCPFEKLIPPVAVAVGETLPCGGFMSRLGRSSRRRRRINSRRCAKAPPSLRYVQACFSSYRCPAVPESRLSPDKAPVPPGNSPWSAIRQIWARASKAKAPGGGAPAAPLIATIEPIAGTG